VLPLLADRGVQRATHPSASERADDRARIVFRVRLGQVVRLEMRSATWRRCATSARRGMRPMGARAPVGDVTISTLYERPFLERRGRPCTAA
jgi:hypothetical protein